MLPWPARKDAARKTQLQARIALRKAIEDLVEINHIPLWDIVYMVAELEWDVRGVLTKTWKLPLD